MAAFSIRSRFALLVLASLCGLSAGCLTPRGATALPKQMLTGASSEPALYLTADAQSPVLGFIAEGVPVDVLGPASGGLIPVRVRSAMQVRAYLPDSLLTLRVQRHGRVRGTPVYLGPDNQVRVVGAGEKADRVRIAAAPKVAGRELAPFTGTYPAKGLAVDHPPAGTELPPEGEPYLVPAGTTLTLYEKPNGKALTELAPQPQDLPARVLGVRGEWRAVRIGDGPYLVGYTNAKLEKAEVPNADRAEQTEATATGSGGSAVPKRLAEEAGELRRVAKNAKVRFDGRVIAKLNQEGYARVLTTYPGGEADALVAIDDEVTIRGLVRLSDLSSATQ